MRTIILSFCVLSCLTTYALVKSQCLDPPGNRVADLFEGFRGRNARLAVANTSQVLPYSVFLGPYTRPASEWAIVEGGDILSGATDKVPQNGSICVDGVPRFNWPVSNTTYSGWDSYSQPSYRCDWLDPVELPVSPTKQRNYTTLFVPHFIINDFYGAVLEIKLTLRHPVSQQIVNHTVWTRAKSCGPPCKSLTMRMASISSSTTSFTDSISVSRIDLTAEYVGASRARASDLTVLAVSVRVSGSRDYEFCVAYLISAILMDEDTTATSVGPASTLPQPTAYPYETCGYNMSYVVDLSDFAGAGKSVSVALGGSGDIDRFWGIGGMFVPINGSAYGNKPGIDPTRRTAPSDGSPILNCPSGLPPWHWTGYGPLDGSQPTTATYPAYYADAWPLSATTSSSSSPSPFPVIATLPSSVAVQYSRLLFYTAASANYAIKITLTFQNGASLVEYSRNASLPQSVFAGTNDTTVCFPPECFTASQTPFGVALGSSSVSSMFWVSTSFHIRVFPLNLTEIDVGGQPASSLNLLRWKVESAINGNPVLFGVQGISVSPVAARPRMTVANQRLPLSECKFNRGRQRGLTDRSFFNVRTVFPGVAELPSFGQPRMGSLAFMMARTEWADLLVGPGYLLSADIRQPCSGSEFPSWDWSYDRSSDAFGSTTSTCSQWSGSLNGPSSFYRNKYEALYLYGTAYAMSSARVRLMFTHPKTGSNIFYSWNFTVPSAFSDNATECLPPSCFVAHDGVRGLYHPTSGTYPKSVPFTGSVSGLKVYAFPLNLTNIIVDEAQNISASQATLTNYVISHVSGCNFVFYDIQGYIAEETFDACAVPPEQVIDLAKGMFVHANRRNVATGPTRLFGANPNIFGAGTGLRTILVDSESEIAQSNATKPWAMWNPESVLQRGRIPCTKDLPAWTWNYSGRTLPVFAGDSMSPSEHMLRRLYVNIPRENRKRMRFLFFYGQLNSPSMSVILHFRINSTYVYKHTWSVTTGNFGQRFFGSCGVDCFWDPRRVEFMNFDTSTYQNSGASIHAVRLSLEALSGFLPSNLNATLSDYPLEKYELSGSGLFIRLIGIAGLNQASLPTEPAPSTPPAQVCTIDESRVYDILEIREYSMTSAVMVTDDFDATLGGATNNNIRFVTEGGTFEQSINQDGKGNAPGSLIPRTERFPCGPGYPSRKNRHSFIYDAFFASVSAGFPFLCQQWEYNLTLTLPSLRRFYTSKLFFTGLTSEASYVSFHLTFENAVNMSIPYRARVDILVPSQFNDDLVNCSAPNCFVSLKGGLGIGRAGDMSTFFGGTWTGINAYTMAIDFETIVLSSSPRLLANETKLIAVEVDGSRACNFQLMDISGVADRAVPQAGIADLPSVPPPPHLETYFCNISNSLIVDLSSSMNHTFNSRIVVANMSELPRFFTGGIANGGEYFPAAQSDISTLPESAGLTLVPANGRIPCGPGHPAWDWRFPNRNNDSYREERCGWTKSVKYDIPYGSRLKYNYMILYLSGYRGFYPPFPVVNLTFNFRRADSSAVSHVHSIQTYRTCDYSWKCFQASDNYPLGYRNPWNPSQFVYLGRGRFFDPVALQINMTEIMVGGTTRASNLFLQNWEIFIEANPLADCRVGVMGLQGFVDVTPPPFVIPPPVNPPTDPPPVFSPTPVAPVPVAVATPTAAPVSIAAPQSSGQSPQSQGASPVALPAPVDTPTNNGRVTASEGPSTGGIVAIVIIVVVLGVAIAIAAWYLRGLMTLPPAGEAAAAGHATSAELSPINSGNSGASPASSPPADDADDPADESSGSQSPEDEEDDDDEEDEENDAQEDEDDEEESQPASSDSSDENS